jgi:hypothetical protein
MAAMPIVAATAFLLCGEAAAGSRKDSAAPKAVRGKVNFQDFHFVMRTTPTTRTSIVRNHREPAVTTTREPALQPAAE